MTIAKPILTGFTGFIFQKSWPDPDIAGPPILKAAPARLTPIAILRIFLDPSPAQLKTKQDDLTREMMAQRRNPFATILVHEWSDSSTPSTSNDHMMAVEPINSDRLDFLVINVIEQGEESGAWIVQNLLPKLQGNNPDAAHNDAITHKFFSVTGPPAHVLFHETNQSGFIDDVINFDLEAQISSDGIKKTSVRHQSGKKIWPV